MRWPLSLGLPLSLALATAGSTAACPLEAGAARLDITPDVTQAPVWLAGFGHGTGEANDSGAQGRCYNMSA